MYINDVNIIVYVVAAILGAIAGQFSDVLNYFLPNSRFLTQRCGLPLIKARGQVPGMGRKKLRTLLTSLKSKS